MNDKKIIELYNARNESAITHTDKKYGSYLKKISYNIVYDLEDAKECVNDTYLKAWNAIPPQKPSVLSVFLARITRFVSVDCLRKKTAGRRGGGEYELSLSELSEVVSGSDDTEDSALYNELTCSIDAFLKKQSTTSCDMFVMRYFYNDSISDIARYCGASESKVKTTLHRIRNDLKDYLTKEGYTI